MQQIFLMMHRCFCSNLVSLKLCDCIRNVFFGKQGFMISCCFEIYPIIIFSVWVTNRFSFSMLQVPDVEESKENRCELTRTPYGRRFINEVCIQKTCFWWLQFYFIFVIWLSTLRLFCLVIVGVEFISNFSIWSNCCSGP